MKTMNKQMNELIEPKPTDELCLSVAVWLAGCRRAALFCISCTVQVGGDVRGDY